MNLTINPKQLRRLAFDKHLPFVDIRPCRKGTRLTTSLSHTVSVVAEGTDVTPMRLSFPDVVRAAKIGKGTFSLDKGICTAGGYTFPMKALPVGDELPRPTKVRLRMSDADITTALTRVANVMSKDETRPHLACLHVQRKDGVVAFTATGGHRLHRATFPSPGKDFVVLIPADTVRSLATMTGDLVLRADDPSATQRVLLRRGREWVLCMPVDARFPDAAPTLKAVENLPHAVTVDSSAMRATLAVMKKHATSLGVCSVRMKYRDGMRLSCTFWSDATDTEQRMTAPTIAATGAMGKAVCVAAAYLMDALPTKGDVTMRFAGELDPFLVESGSVRAVVMPRREKLD